MHLSFLQHPKHLTTASITVTTVAGLMREHTPSPQATQHAQTCMEGMGDRKQRKRESDHIHKCVMFKKGEFQPFKAFK